MMSEQRFLRAIPQLPVTDVEASAEWYHRALGFEIVFLNEDPDDDDPTNYAGLRQGEVEVHLILDEDSSAKAGTAYLYLITRNVEEIYDTVKSKSVTIARELRTEPWGAKAFNVLDPDGNTVHISE